MKEKAAKGSVVLIAVSNKFLMEHVEIAARNFTRSEESFYAKESKKRLYCRYL